MPKRLARCVYSIDGFPDDILCHIISLLPFKEAVRTSILSRKWRYLFCLSSNLEFYNGTTDEKKQKWFMNLIDRFVLCRDRPSIQKFRLRCRAKIDSQRVSEWICALVRHKIEKLDLGFKPKLFNKLDLPESLFSCETLVVLKLDLRLGSYELKVPDRICLPRLKTLHLKAIRFSNVGFAERIFLGCPVLEDLDLSECSFTKGGAKLNVLNPNLKRLSLYLDTSIEGEIVPIFISTPSVVYLDYKISSGYTLEIIDVKSLTEARIGFHLRGLQNVSWFTAAAGALRQIQNIQKLFIINSDLKFFQRFDVPIPLFDKMISLKIWGFNLGFDLICFEYFLARCIVLETLVFEGHFMGSRNTNNQYMMQKSQLAPLLGRLKMIEINLYDITDAEILMTAIEFFLKNARVLEVLKICSERDRRQEKSEIVRKIKSFPRVSQECMLSF